MYTKEEFSEFASFLKNLATNKKLLSRQYMESEIVLNECLKEQGNQELQIWL